MLYQFPRWWRQRRQMLGVLFVLAPVVWCAFTMLLCTFLGETLSLCMPYAFMQDPQDKPIHLLVLLPLLGLKRSAALANATLTEERLSTQSWAVVARELTRVASPGSSVRILGMVAAAEHCDPWIRTHIHVSPPSSSYSCRVPARECLHPEHGGIPTKCMVEAALEAAQPEEVLILARGDVLVTPSFTQAFLDVHQRLANSEEPDGPRMSNFVLVGQRIDTSLGMGEIPLVLTLDGLEQASTRALAHSVLYQDSGIDYFVFPQQLYPQPHDLPSLPRDRFRWDYSLLASFIRNGAKVIDMTETIPVLHLGVKTMSADSQIHVRRTGSASNSNFAHGQHGSSYMLGGIGINADYTHVVLEDNQTFALVHSDSQADADLARILQRALHAASSSMLEAEPKSESEPLLLLVTVKSMDDIMWARKWIAAASLQQTLEERELRHVVFLTHEAQIFQSLEALNPGGVLLQPAAPYATPSLALRWLTFWKLLTRKVSVAIADVEDFALLVAGASSLRREWPCNCDVLLKGRSSNIDVVAVRSRPNASDGLDFLRMFRDCHPGLGHDGLQQRQQQHHHHHQQDPTTLHGPPRVNQTVAGPDCLARLMAGTVDVSADDATFVHDAGGNDGRIRICFLAEPTVNTRQASRALRTASLPYDSIQWTLAKVQPIDHTLHVVLTVSNAAGYKTRYALAQQFIERVERKASAHIVLYVVELAYGNQTHAIAQSDHPRHLQLRTTTPLWHKENLINLGVERLLPEDWCALAWVDAEIEFESPTWALDTLRVLGSGRYDVVQLFSHGVDLDARGHTTKVYTGFGHNYLRQIPYQKKGTDLWHPGYAWACTREAYDQIGGLFEGNILGGNDQSTAYAILGMHAQLPDTPKMFPSPGYKNAVLAWERKFQGLRPGYVPGVVNHHFHGSVGNRHYWERRDLLSDARFDPQVHLQRDPESGVIKPTAEFPKDLAARILDYFKSRKEDEDEQEQQHATMGHPISSVAGDTLAAIQSNLPVDSSLHVIVLIYPPAARRDTMAAMAHHILVADYLARVIASWANDPLIEMYIVELAQDGQGHFHHTRSDNRRHLQVHLPDPQIWSKGNILNLAIEKLLPEDWQALGYVDAGTEFDSLTWPHDTLRLLSEETFGVAQLFSHAIQLNAGGNTTRIWTGFGYNSARGIPREMSTTSPDCWYPGGGWAYARRVFDRAGGQFFEGDIGGQFDSIQAWSLLDRGSDTVAKWPAPASVHMPDAYKESMLDYALQWRQANVRVGYVPGVTRQVGALIPQHFVTETTKHAAL
jgi:hypothetical protein